MMILVLCVASYLLGSIPFALIVGKVGYGIDIRQHGSGNLGGTNTFRTLGKKAGFLVTTGDVLKGTVATLLPTFFNMQEPSFLPLLCGVCAVIGHAFPIFAKFKGGKAVATSAGVVLAYNPLVFLGLAVIFFSLLLTVGYVSLTSMVTALSGLIASLFLGDIPFMLIFLALSVFIVYRHRTNIQRIREGTEPRVKFSYGYKKRQQ